MKVLTKRQAAQLINVSERTLHRLMHADVGLNPIRLSERRRGLAEDDVLAYLARNKQQAATEEEQAA